MKFYYFFFFGFLAVQTSSNLIAQSHPEADSMYLLIRKSKDSVRVSELLNEIGWVLKKSDPEQAKNALLQSIAIANRHDYAKEAGDAYNYLGVLESIRDSLDAASTYWESSLQIRKSIQDRKGEAKIYNNLGILYKNQNDFPQAIFAYRQAEAIYAELDNPVKVGNLSYNIAKLYEQFGHYTQAIEYIYKYLNNLEEQATLPDLSVDELQAIKSNEANAYDLLGTIKYSLGRLTESKQAFYKARNLCQALEDQYTLASVYNNIGNLFSAYSWNYSRDSLFEQAIAYQDSAIVFYKKSLDIRSSEEEEALINELYFNIATCERDKGLLYKQIGKQDLFRQKLLFAESEMTRLKAVWEAWDNQFLLMQVESALFEVYHLQGKHQQAIEVLDHSYQLALSSESEWYIQRSLEDFSKHYKAIGAYEKALQYSEDYNIYRFSKISEKQVQDIEMQSALYLDQKNIREIEKKQEALKLSNLQLRISYGIIGVVVFGLMVFVFVAIRFKMLNNKIQGLLLNILPPSVVDRIKKDPKDDCATQFDAATILFSDFAGFTEISAQIPPDQLLDQLNAFFTAFDEIMTEEGVERIKTIGDAYMCVAGVPDPISDHASRMLRAALKMRHAVNRINAQNQQAGIPIFNIRIGINTGPVSGGIVGIRKYAYDVWGDSVNVASRMESMSTIGGITMSSATYQLIQQDLEELNQTYSFELTPRSKVRVKGKGEMDLFTLQ